MRELNTNLLALGVCEVHDALQGFYLGVLPETAVFGSDPTFGCYGCGFDEREAGAARDYATEMGLMTVLEQQYGFHGWGALRCAMACGGHSQPNTGREARGRSCSGVSSPAIAEA